MATDGERLAAIVTIIRDYYYALDSREHGGLAEHHAFSKIEDVMGMQWRQGEELKRRGAKADGD